MAIVLASFNYNLKLSLVKRVFIAITLCVAFFGCTESFEELNTNPNAPTSVPTSYLLTQGQRALVNGFLGQGGVSELGVHYIQHLSQTQYSNVTRYSDVNSSFYGFYTGGLADLQEIITINEDPERATLASATGPNINQIAVAKILQSWAFMSMTDIWGDLPYSQSLKGVEFVLPAYDTQEDIYRGLVAELTAAASSIVDGPIEGDIIFEGAMDKWRRFAYSLILRAGLRVSEADPALAQEWVSLALSGGVMESNDDLAQFAYVGTGEAANNEYFNDFQTRTDYAISTTMTDALEARNDPRMGVFGQPTEASMLANEPKVIGMPYGLTQGESGAIPVTDVSFPGLSFISATSPAVLMSYSEVLFAQAEAAARGWTGSDAEALYGEAVTASMNQHGILDEAAITAYLGQDVVAYDSDIWRERIGTQKWIALYFQGLEAWAEWRRLDFPELSPAPEPLETQQIPRRRGYPIDETTLNSDNLDVAVERQFDGADNLDGRVWWDQ